MGSRARSATAACLIGSGLLFGATATASADPGADADSESVAANVRAELLPTGPARPPQAERTRRISGDADSHSDRTPAGRESEPDRVSGKPKDRGDRGPVAGADPDIPPPCCDERDKDCPSLPPLDPWPQTGPPESTDDDRPVVLPPTMPTPALGPQRTDVLDVVPGVDLGSSDASELPIDVPVVIAGPAGFNPAAGPYLRPGAAPSAPAAPASPATPAAPRRQGTPGQPPMPANAGATIAGPTAAGRAGYGEYLRAAGFSQIAALALPGLAGILILTGAGGLLGYRQAKAAQGVRASGITRFMN